MTKKSSEDTKKGLKLPHVISEALKTLRSFKSLPLSNEEKLELNTILGSWKKLWEHNRTKGWHSLLVGFYAYKLSGENYKYFYAGLIHDIGHLNVTNCVLDSPDRLDSADYEYAKNHILFGQELAKQSGINDEVYSRAIADHHESFDGTGYPNGKGQNAISNEGKIIQLADIIEANMGIPEYTKRTYVKDDQDFQKFLNYFTYEFGTKIDPDLKPMLKSFSDWYFKNFA